MPPKKIDPAKRGDVSMAQFVYDGDIDRSESASAVPPQLKPTTTPSTSTPATQMETDDLAESSLLRKLLLLKCVSHTLYELL
jgi:hypothetical protein